MSRSRPRTRRQFLRDTALTSALLGSSELAWFGKLPRVSAAEATPHRDLVTLAPQIEPLVKLLEDTPREKLLEEVGSRIKSGLAYRDVLAALLLAGVRNVEPRPSVGFKFHAVLVVNSAHLASLASPPEQRWLPIFWALDYFKKSQAETIRESGWRMAAIDDAKVPSATKARQAFQNAMDHWDAEAVDSAVAGLARTAGAQEVFELFARYGARDFRSIGHKAIFVANSWRTLQCIGWQHAEPVLRSLAYALVNHERDPNPATADLPADRVGRRNSELSTRLPANWLEGKPNPSATKELLATLRTAKDEEASNHVAELLSAGVAPASIWDAIFASSGELLMRQPGIVALHASTTSNAMRYAFENTAVDVDRRFLLLQNASFVTLFRDAMKSRGEVADVEIDAIEAANVPTEEPEAIAGILNESDRMTAAQRAFGLQSERASYQLIDAARLIVFRKGNDSHDYKFSSAVFEDYGQLSNEWGRRFLAASLFQLPKPQERDNPLVERTKEALT
jgi:hypothetical protein